MLTTKEAEQYLSESRVSLAVARERALENKLRWTPWVSAFIGRCRSLESALPRLRKREADALRFTKQFSNEPSVVARRFPRLDAGSVEAE